MLSYNFNPVNGGSINIATALIVDDEKDICYLLNNILKQKNIQSELAGSIAEADKLIEKQTPSVIFLDNHLPDGLGIDNIGRIKSSHPEIKIIMITAHDNPAERQKAYQQGVDAFISKPFKKDIIYNALASIESNTNVE